jgi:hypothetical protein
MSLFGTERAMSNDGLGFSWPLIGRKCLQPSYSSRVLLRYRIENSRTSPASVLWKSVNRNTFLDPLWREQMSENDP